MKAEIIKQDVNRMDNLDFPCLLYRKSDERIIYALTYTPESTGTVKAIALNTDIKSENKNVWDWGLQGFELFTGEVKLSNS